MDSLTTFNCPVCKGPITVSLTKKGNGLHLRCKKDGKHLRAFIMDQVYVDGVKRRAGDLG